MLAHYHYSVERVWNETPFSLMLELYDGALNYIIMTNPWGSGDDEEEEEAPNDAFDHAHSFGLDDPGKPKPPKPRPKDPFFDAKSDSRFLVDKGFVSPVVAVHKSKDSVPEDLRDLLR